MNGNDMLIIEEEQAERIEQDYIQAVREGECRVPRYYLMNWIESYLQGDE